MNLKRIVVAAVVVFSFGAFAADPIGNCANEKLGTCTEHVKKNDSSDAKSCKSVKGTWTAKTSCAAEDRVFSCELTDGRTMIYFKKFLKIGGMRDSMKDECGSLKGTFTDLAK